MNRTMIQAVNTATDSAPRRALTTRARHRPSHLGWLFLIPALSVYGIFVLWPILQTIRYSFYSWDGVDKPQWAGLRNFRAVFTDPQLTSTLVHVAELILFFTVIPVGLGLVLAAIMQRVTSRRVTSVARAVLILPQIVPLVAAGIAWSWVLSSSGVVNQVLQAIGLRHITRAWLGDFTTALPSVGLIGAWVLLGLCTVLLSVGMGKIDASLYEAAVLDGAGRIREFFAVTLPSLRNEIAVCVTVTMISALSAFDIVYITTQGGPGNATMVPGLKVYQLAFFNRQVGLASALALVLMVIVILCIMPVQSLSRRSGDE